jgi:hypothetical protein
MIIQAKASPCMCLPIGINSQVKLLLFTPTMPLPLATIKLCQTLQYYSTVLSGITSLGK